MHYEDLEPYGMDAALSQDGNRVLAAGWLENGYDYSRGPVDPPTISRLFAFARHRWWRGALGYHSCDLCPAAPPRTGTVVEWRERTFLGVSRTRQCTTGDFEFFVPARGCVYVAPSLILHYSLAHGYAPPPEFIEAVLACPDVRTPEYAALVRDNGGAHLAPCRDAGR